VSVSWALSGAGHAAVEVVVIDFRAMRLAVAGARRFPQYECTPTGEPTCMGGIA